MVRTKLCDVQPKRPDVRTIHAFSPAAASPCSFERPYASIRERLRERGPELARGACYEQAALSRSDRIGSLVLHRCFTRASAQQRPCSSGEPVAYSSVTW